MAKRKSSTKRRAKSSAARLRFKADHYLDRAAETFQSLGARWATCANLAGDVAAAGRFMARAEAALATAPAAERRRAAPLFKSTRCRLAALRRVSKQCAAAKRRPFHELEAWAESRQAVLDRCDVAFRRRIGRK